MLGRKSSDDEDEPILPLLDKAAADASDVASSSFAAKLWAAFFYAGTSLFTVFVMKIVLTSYGFPSALFVGLSQFILTSLVFGSLGVLGLTEIAPPTPELLFRVFPLTIIFMVNVVSGLGGTKEISLPMFTVLRRFSILFTMVLEARVFGKAPPPSVKLSVFLMLSGAIIAALSDLSFHPTGCVNLTAAGV